MVPLIKILCTKSSPVLWSVMHVYNSFGEPGQHRVLFAMKLYFFTLIILVYNCVFALIGLNIIGFSLQLQGDRIKYVHIYIYIYSYCLFSII